MRTWMILLAMGLSMAGPALAQNAKGTGAEDKTTTSTNPVGTSINPPPTASHGDERAADAPIDPGNPKATKNSQGLDDPKKGLLGK